MTKRMLSLLLALVMTLSLCVPALAADEFAAEAVTEVEEQAPEAPVEPEAPEAEEPVEEPVADEPVVEEADAPEIAAVMEEEDLPLLVALGVVTKDAHWALYKAVTAADEIMADVNAGVYRQNDVTFTTLDVATYLSDPTEENDPFKKATADFLEAYEKAAEMLAAVDGKEVDYDVTTASVEDAAAALEVYLPVVPATTYTLVKTVDSSMSKNNLVDLLEGAIATYDEGSGTSTEPELDVSDADKLADVDVTKGDWPKAYQAGYLKDLQSAIDAVLSYTEGSGATAAAYADFTAILKQVIDVCLDEFEAARPAASNMSALKSAISKAESAKDSYKAPSKYALKTDESVLASLIGQANDLLSDTQGLNGFDTNATYYAYNKAITEINNALVTKTNSIRYEAHKLNASNPKKAVDVTVTVVEVPGVLGKPSTDDGNKYGYSYKVGDYWFTGSTTAGSKNFSDAIIQPCPTTYSSSTTYSGRLEATISQIFNVVGSANDGSSSVADFDPNAKITIQFHLAKNDTATANTDFYRSTVSTKTFEVFKQGYAGPTIKEVKYVSGGSQVTINSYAGLIGESATDVSLSAHTPASLTVTLTKAMGTKTTQASDPKDYVAYSLYVKNGSKTAVSTSSAFDASFQNVSVQADGTGEPYFVGGDMTVKLDVDLTSDPAKIATPNKNLINRSSATVKVEPLSKWSQVYQVKKVIKEAGELVKSDYEFQKSDSNRVDVRTVDQAFQVINNGKTKLNNLITGATVANTDANRTQVVDTINDMIAACKHLKAKTADTAALDKLIAEAQEIVDGGEDPWTFDSWGALKDALNDAINDVDPDSLQSEVDELAKDLQAALKGMTKEGAVDKTALSAAIAEAKALKEEDYTPESWATAKPAIDEAVTAAEAVLANENATQAQVNNAVNAIKAAIATLESVNPEGPQAPAGGTGWVLDDGVWYFFKGGKLVSNYWVGKIDGASKWDNNWYYVGSDGKMFTGMAYIDDLHGGYGWYFLQPTNTKGEIGKMLTGWQWVGGDYGECYFSSKNGSSGKCTWSEKLGDYDPGTCYFSAKNGEAGKCTYSTVKGNWNGTAWEK